MTKNGLTFCSSAAILKLYIEMGKGMYEVRVHIINILIILNAKAIIHCTGEDLKITTETHINTSILQIC